MKVLGQWQVQRSAQSPAQVHAPLHIHLPEERTLQVLDEIDCLAGALHLRLFHDPNDFLKKDIEIVPEVHLNWGWQILAYAYWSVQIRVGNLATRLVKIVHAVLKAP